MHRHRAGGESGPADELPERAAHVDRPGEDVHRAADDELRRHHDRARRRERADQRQQLRVPRASRASTTACSGRRVAPDFVDPGRGPDQHTGRRSGLRDARRRCRRSRATRSARSRGRRPARNPRARPARSSSSSPGDGGASLPADYGTLGTVTAGIENAQKIASLAPPGAATARRPIPMYLVSVEITESLRRVELPRLTADATPVRARRRRCTRPAG